MTFECSVTRKFTTRSYEMNYRTISSILAAAVFATACGGGGGGGGKSAASSPPANGNPSRGELTSAPALVQSLSAPQLASQLSSISPALLAVAGQPKCSVSIYSIGYRTIGGKNEATTAGAVMVPTVTHLAALGRNRSCYMLMEPRPTRIST